MDDELDRLREENQELRQRVKLLEERIDFLVRQVFGQSSEKLDPRQLELFLEGSESGKEDASAANAEDLLAEANSNKRKTKRERKPRLPENLPVEEEVIEPDAVKANPEQFRRIGEEVSELLDYEPGRFLRRVIIRPKYIKRSANHEPPIVARKVDRRRHRCTGTFSAPRGKQIL